MARTNRKPYTGSKAVDPSCRSHGSCPWCKGGRKAKAERQKPAEITIKNKLESTDKADRRAELDLSIYLSYLKEKEIKL